MSVIEVRRLKKAFKQHQVLKGIDLDVDEGEIVVIIGASGSGKTTLLRCLNFLEKADEGSYRLDGLSTDLKHVTKKQITAFRLKTAMVFQTYGLFLNKTAQENIMEGLVVARKVPKKEAAETAKSVLTQVGLGDRLNARPYQLSGGEQQRVGIARALALNPEVILFDEPTSALDPEKVNEILDLIRDVVSCGKTAILVTHEMEFAYDVADKVIFIDNGEIVEQGTPQQVLGDPQQERTQQFLARFMLGKQPEYFL
ncbi:MAG: amino acid ABC transporter ATP-binding protein [Coriobacteriales bacterium]|jgi:L-cystine transport system ATP-binding protein|nr:amino acid ABC transporter ATP-binding protein [Coriobacteriales bacterium]